MDDIGLLNSIMDCKVDTIKSNTSRIKQYLGKEAQPLCESIEIKINEGIPENEAKVFVERRQKKPHVKSKHTRYGY